MLITRKTTLSELARNHVYHLVSQVRPGHAVAEPPHLDLNLNDRCPFAFFDS
jgi:hypothetical protein